MGQRSLFLENDAHDQLCEQLYQKLNNGVYRVGYAKNQAAYDEASKDVYDMLDWLEDRLAGQEFLMGRNITYSDLQLFVTLVRFDAVYVPLHQCTRRRLVDYPHLWAYARRLFHKPGFAATVDWQAILTASFANDTDRKSTIIPDLPDHSWDLPGELPGEQPSEEVVGI